MYCIREYGSTLYTSKLNILQIKMGNIGIAIYMRQDQDVQYMLLSIRCCIYSDRMRTDAISESMIQVLYCRAVSCCECTVLDTACLII